MFLKYLELAGFKSFAKKTKLEFKTPVTAIVGPNGSGKSNVAESFRFVLGEQRMTQMRSKRTEDLIWNGSHTMPKAHKARVGLAFNNQPAKVLDGSRLFNDVDFDEIVLERVIHRDASTEYVINGSTVRLKDTIELLSSAHIGSSGHHIISQGETDRILLVNARERKTMIEDALGLKVYQYKKLESQRKLERTEQHKKEVESLRREIAPHLKFLKTQVEKVEKTQQMRDELRDLYTTYLAAEENRLSDGEKQLETQKQPLAEELKAVTESLQDARQTLSELEERDEKSDELLHLEEALSDIRKQKDILTREVGQLEGEIRAHKKVGVEQGSTVPVKEVLAFRDQLEQELSQVEHSEDVSTFQQVIGRIREHIARFVESFTEDETDLNKEYEEAKQNKTTKEQALGTLEKKEQELTASYNDLKQSIEEDRDSGREAERAVFTLSSKEQEIRMKLASIERDMTELSEDREAFAEEKQEARVLVGELTVDQQVRFENETEGEKTRKQIERLKIRLEDSGTGTGEDVMKEYKEVQDRDAFLERELGDLGTSLETLHALIKDLDEKLDTLFHEGVQKINVKFQELFALMFGGGTASLKLIRESEEEEDSGEEEVLSEGIEIAVNLPRKKIRGLHMLSGGERALTSIALLFAMSQVNPPPFLVLDETDAALDEANSRRYGDMIEALSKDSQLIVITHNRETMSRAGVLYGVTMGSDGVSQLLSVSLDEAVRVAK